MPKIEVDLTGCCKECFMPLHGGICEFDPEHGPLPLDFSDADLADWFPTWLNLYMRRQQWPFAVYGPVPPITPKLAAGPHRLSPTLSMGYPVNDLSPAVKRRNYVMGIVGRPLCPACRSALVENQCPLVPEHDVSCPLFETKPSSQAAAPSRHRIAAMVSSKAASSPATSSSAGAPKISNVKHSAEPHEISPCRVEPGYFRRTRPLPQSIEAWLKEMDDEGFLMPYHGHIAASFDSPAQIVDVYVRLGSNGRLEAIDPKFFTDIGVKKVGHRRLFEKWFVDNL